MYLSARLAHTESLWRCMKNWYSYAGHFPGFYTGCRGPVSPDVQLTCGVREMEVVLDTGDDRLKEGR